MYSQRLCGEMIYPCAFFFFAYSAFFAVEYRTVKDTKDINRQEAKEPRNKEYI
jgi:hypothetical protein